MGNYVIDLAGGDNAVLLVHGMTGSPFEMRYLAKKLNKAGFTVKAPYLAGHGTTVEDIKKTTWQDWYRTISDAFAELKEHHTSVAVSGLCTGAVLALYLAYKAKDAVAGLSLLSTTLFHDGWCLPWYRYLMPIVYYTPLRFVFSLRDRAPYGIKNERLRKRRISTYLRDNAIAYSEIPCTCMYESIKLTNRVKKILPKITTPTLLIHSVEDDIASVNNADYVEKHIGSKHVHKVLLHDSYHIISMDNERELVVDETITFFKEYVKK